MKFWNDFKEFIVRGNMMDMAIGIVMGAAFSKVVTSFVSDIVMPPIGLLLGHVNFSKLVITLVKKNADHAAITINYGLFINNIVDLLIVGFSIFIVVKQLNRFHHKKAAEVVTKDCPECCSKININAKRCPNCTSAL